MEITLSLRHVKRSLIIIIAILFGAYLVTQTIEHTIANGRWLSVLDRFDVENEQSIPTWLSQTQLFIAAVCIAVIALYKKGKNDIFTRHWSWLAVIFVYLSADEGATLHEAWGEPIKDLFGVLPGYLHFAWVIPFAVFLLIALIAYWKFLKALPPMDRRGFLLSGALFIGGAMGVEMIAAEILTSGLPHHFYVMAAALEEVLEMAGSALFIVTLLLYIQRHVTIDSVRIAE